MINQILYDWTGLGDHERLALLCSVRCDCDDGRFAQRMDLFEFGRGEHVLSLVCLELVRDLQLFQKP